MSLRVLFKRSLLLKRTVLTARPAVFISSERRCQTLTIEEMSDCERAPDAARVLIKSAEQGMVCHE